MSGREQGAGRLSELLQGRFSGAEISVEDTSDEHLGHAEGEGLSHFSVRISSGEFSGLSQVRRHRLVYEAIGDLAELRIHSLSIEALSPSDTA